MDDTDRHAALEPLEALVGEWSVEAAFPGADMGDVPGRTTFEWALGGQFLLQRGAVDHPAAPDGLMVIAPDSEGDGYLQHYFDSRGVVRLYRMTLGGGIWTLTRDKPDFSPLPFAQRFTAEVRRDTIRGAWEASEDGANWDHDFALTYTRAG
jgi:hypothetical protein